MKQEIFYYVFAKLGEEQIGYQLSPVDKRVIYFFNSFIVPTNFVLDSGKKKCCFNFIFVPTTLALSLEILFKNLLGMLSVF